MSKQSGRALEKTNPISPYAPDRPRLPATAAEPAVGPEHALWKDVGRVHYVAANDSDVLEFLLETLGVTKPPNGAVRRFTAFRKVLAAIQAENMRLRDLVDSSFKVGDRVLVAELSSVDLDPYKQQVIINKGAASGAFEGQPVLDAHAVMGQVTNVTPLTSTVLLITDTSHALPVQVLRNGLRTIALGTGRIDELKLPYLPTNSDIVEGGDFTWNANFNLSSNRNEIISLPNDDADIIFGRNINLN